MLLIVYIAAFECWTWLGAYSLVVLHHHSLGNTGEFYKDWEESFDSFDAMGLHENLLRGIYAHGRLCTLMCAHTSTCPPPPHPTHTTTTTTSFL